jgi:hypothetical protein
MFWAEGQLTSATLRGKVEGKHTVRYGDRVTSVALTPGQAVRMTARSFS